LLLPPSGSANPQRIGLLAAWGRYPLIVAQALQRQGLQVCCLGCRDIADARLARMCYDFRWIGVSRLGAAIRYFREHDVHWATMAGKFPKTMLYQPWLALRHLPDWRMLRTFYPYLLASRRDRKDDTLLTAVVDAFAEDGIRFAPATDFAPELLVKPGQLTGRPLSTTQRRDIRFGWQVAKEMGRLDIGQSVCVKDRAVMAVEAIEGTDLCIRRAGELCRHSGFTVVKVAKPNQDMRFDVPTVGVGTLETMHQAGGKVLAIEAGRTILLDEAEFIAAANRYKIAVVAVDAQAVVGEREESPICERRTA